MQTLNYGKIKIMCNWIFAISVPLIAEKSVFRKIRRLFKD